MDLNDIEGAIAAGSRLHGVWKDRKIPYLNGDLEGNRDLLEAGDALEAMSGHTNTSIKIAGIYGQFSKCLLQKLNPDISDQECFELATKQNIEDMFKVWTQS